MGKKDYKKYYFIALACLIAACAYPIYMGIYVIVETCANGFVRVEDYPKYVIPYTPIAIAQTASSTMAVGRMKPLWETCFFMAVLLIAATGSKTFA